MRHDRLDEGRFKSVWEDAMRAYLLRPRFKTAIALMLYMVTLQRPIDVCRALKRDFNLERRTWRIVDETKTEVEYFIPLSDLAIAFVRLAMSWNDSKWLFPKSGARGDHIPSTHVTNFWTHMRTRLVKSGEWDERDIELYDCRRFGRTELEKSLNVSKAVAERVINHSEPAGMDTRYDVHNYSDDVRRAQTAWGQHVEKLIGIGASDLARKLGAAVVKPLQRRPPHLRKA